METDGGEAKFVALVAVVALVALVTVVLGERMWVAFAVSPHRILRGHLNLTLHCYARMSDRMTPS